MNQPTKLGFRFLRRSVTGSELWIALATCLIIAASAYAQDNGLRSKPYATLDRQAVTYQGPTDTHGKELPAGTAVIGMILPLHGPEQEQGRALLAAAQKALEEEQTRGPLPDGRKLALAVRDESGPWGQASSEILKLVDQDHALVVLTSANGNIAHQAEQLANKISFPILTLASDPATTETNVPWVSRLGPSDTDQARAFGQRIYTKLGLRNVLLIAQSDHDGRIGSGEFEKVAKQLEMPALQRVELSSATAALSLRSALIQERSPEAVVVWTDALTAMELLPTIRKSLPTAPIFWCTKAAQFGIEDTDSFTLSSPQLEKIAAPHSNQLFGAADSYAGMSAVRVYEAVHFIAAGLRAVGVNRVLLRDYFASEHASHDSAETLKFDPAGNCVNVFTIIELTNPQPQASR